MIFKTGAFRLLTVLVFLTAVFFALNLISLKKTPPPPAEKTPCPFVLAVSPPFTGGLTAKGGEFSAAPGPAKRPEVSGKLREMPETAGGGVLHEIGFFSAVLSRTRAENDPSIELVFYLPLHLTRDSRWIVSESPFMTPRPSALTEKAPQITTAKQALTNPDGPSSQKAPLKRISNFNPDSMCRKKIPQLTLREIQTQFSSKKIPTLKSLLNRFPKQKWFLHFFTENREEAFKSLKDAFEKNPDLYITSNNEKFLQLFSKKPITVIYGFRTLVRSQLLNIFFPKKLFSFPGRGLVVSSKLPLSPDK